MLKKGNTKRSSPPAGAKGNGHKLPTNFHELFLVLILVYNYGFVKIFYRLDKTLSQARQNFVKGMINFYHRLDNSCCYLLFFLFGLSSCLRIRGYFITHPRLREVFALSSRLIGCLFLFFLTQISQISRNLLPSLVFCFTRISRNV